jgi:hypothetical protein
MRVYPLITLAALCLGEEFAAARGGGTATRLLGSPRAQLDEGLKRVQSTASDLRTAWKERREHRRERKRALKRARSAYIDFLEDNDQAKKEHRELIGENKRLSSGGTVMETLIGSLIAGIAASPIIHRIGLFSIAVASSAAVTWAASRASRANTPLDRTMVEMAKRNQVPAEVTENLVKARRLNEEALSSP